jgi:hypothetical protein
VQAVLTLARQLHNGRHFARPQTSTRTIWTISITNWQSDAIRRCCARVSLQNGLTGRIFAPRSRRPVKTISNQSEAAIRKPQTGRLFRTRTSERSRISS